MSKKPSNKIYAVQVGRITGIFLDWQDCKKQIDGYPGAAYKSFPIAEIDNAQRYLSGIATVNVATVSHVPAKTIQPQQAASAWQQIALCPPKPMQWCNVVYENEVGEHALFPGIVWRLPNMQWKAVGSGSALLSKEVSDTFRLFLPIPDWDLPSSF